MNFYKDAFNAEITMLQRYADSPKPFTEFGVPEEWAQKIMHAEFCIGPRTVMLSDSPGDPEAFSGVSLTVSLEREDEVRRVFEKLTIGGEIRQQLGQEFWSPLFGMVQDKFGLLWTVTLPLAAPEA